MYLSRFLVRVSPLVQRPVPRQTLGLLVNLNKFSSRPLPSDKRDTNPSTPVEAAKAPTPVQSSSNNNDAAGRSSDSPDYSTEGILADLKEAVMKKQTNSYSQFIAQKLFDFAAEKNQTQQIIDEFEKLISAIDENEDVSNFVKYSTIITREQWGELQGLLKEKKVPEVFVNAITALHKLHKLRVLPKILDILKAKQDEAQGIVRGELVTAEEYSQKKLDAFIQELYGHIDAKQIILKTRVDKSLIGGFVLSTPPLKLDTSHSSIINAANAEHAQREEDELRKLTRAWESGLPAGPEKKPEPSKLVAVAQQSTKYDGPIKTRADLYARFEAVVKSPEIQAEYRSYAPVSDPDLFLRDIQEQLSWREDGKQLHAEYQAREAYWASLEWDPDMPEDLAIPYLTGKHQPKV